MSSNPTVGRTWFECIGQVWPIYLPDTSSSQSLHLVSVTLDRYTFSIWIPLFISIIFLTNTFGRYSTPFLPQYRTLVLCLDEHVVSGQSLVLFICFDLMPLWVTISLNIIELCTSLTNL
ncbi:unnamed protein product [Cochlearia groenlandica]